MKRLSPWIAAAALAGAGVLTSMPPVAAGASCFGREATRTVGPNRTGHYYGTNGNDVIVGNIGPGGGYATIVIHGRGGDDRICVNNAGKIKGEDGADKIRGDRAQLFGGPGADRSIDWYGSGYAEGGPGPDRLLDEGGSGDSFYGQAGNDYINLNPAGGSAYGGTGRDTCVGRVPPSTFHSCEE
jgi:hypothetical protein